MRGDVVRHPRVAGEGAGEQVADPGRADAAPVKIAVIEAPTKRLEGGLGYSTDVQFRGNASYRDVDLDGKTETGEAPTKTCPACEAEIPLAATECPLCGEAFPRDDEEAGEGGGAAPLSGFMMTEIDLLKRSSFAWVDLYGTDDALMATGFAAWGGIVASLNAGREAELVDGFIEQGEADLVHDLAAPREFSLPNDPVLIFDDPNHGDELQLLANIRLAVTNRRWLTDPIKYFAGIPPRKVKLALPATRTPGELVIYKERASAFFGTPLIAHLQMMKIDSLIICGESTSGCVRASTDCARAMPA